MTATKERAPTFAMGGFKQGQRIVYRCPDPSCHFVSVGVTELYKGESITEIGSLDGIW